MAAVCTEFAQTRIESIFFVSGAEVERSLHAFHGGLRLILREFIIFDHNDTSSWIDIDLLYFGFDNLVTDIVAKNLDVSGDLTIQKLAEQANFGRLNGFRLKVSIGFPG